MSKHRQNRRARVLAVTGGAAAAGLAIVSLGAMANAQTDPASENGAAKSPSAAEVGPGGMANLNWSLDKESDKVKHLSLPFTVNEDSGAETPYYWAQQFYFANGSDGAGAYAGVQPGDGGKFLFSVFGPGVTSNSENCSDGADGGDGVSCKVGVKYTKGSEYTVNVDNTSGSTWTGTVVGPDGGKTEIGSWTVPAEWGGLKSSGVGFVEHYGSVPSCAEVQKGDAVFGNVSSSDGGKGKTEAGEAYGDCEGTVPVDYAQTDDGVRVTTGSK